MPPMPLYMLAGAGSARLRPLVSTGELALTLYVAHVVLGMGGLEALGRLENQTLPFSLLCSALCDRRGRAIGIVFGILVASMILNFLAPNAAWADRVSFLGVLDYYRPVDMLTTGAVPVRNILTLLAVAVVTWTAGLEVFAQTLQLHRQNRRLKFCHPQIRTQHRLSLHRLGQSTEVDISVAPGSQVVVVG